MDDHRRQELERREKATPITDRAVDRATIDEVRREWQTSPDYNAALSLNRLFIKGKRTCSIYHWATLEEETAPLIPGLLALHDYGLMTYGSQPFDRKPERLAIGGGYWYQIRQRPYLSFMTPLKDRIPQDTIERFCTLLLMHSRIVAIVKQPGQPFRSSMPETHIVTITRSALSIEELYAEPFKPYTCVPCNGTLESETWEVEAVIAAECLNISVASRSWDEDMDLLALIEGVAVAAGLERVYAETS